MRSCNDQVGATSFPNSGKTVRRGIQDAISINSLLCLGKHTVCIVGPEHKSRFISHSTKQFVVDNVLASGIESIRAVFRWCVLDAYYKLIAKHLQLYLTEVCFGFTSVKVKFHTAICFEVPI